MENTTNNKNLDFNRLILFHISKLIKDGRPLMGMLVANEYLEQASFIRINLANLARNAINEFSDYIYPEKFLYKILDEGYTFSKLSFHEQEIIVNSNEKSFTNIETKKIPQAKILDINKTRAQEGIEKLKEVYIRSRRTKRIQYEKRPYMQVINS